MDPEDTDVIELGQSIKVAAIAGVVGIVLIGFIFIQYSMVKNRQGTIVLPAGDTYLGPTPTPVPQEQSQPASAQQEQKFTAPENDDWVTVRGNVYDYSFRAPSALTLVTFDDDPYDIYAIDWNNLNPSSNVLIGVDNLKNDENKVQYVDQPKRTYVDNWWRQFGALKGVSSVVPFVNSQGLQGYRAKYFNQQNQTPFLDVFFEVPGRPELVIHLANGVLSDDVFERIIDSITWGEPAAALEEPVSETSTEE